jgi:hypothetical protein
MLKEIASKENMTESIIRRQRIQRELEQAQLRRMYRI